MALQGQQLRNRSHRFPWYTRTPTSDPATNSTRTGVEERHCNNPRIRSVVSPCDQRKVRVTGRGEKTTYVIASRVERIAAQAAARTTHWGICAVTIGNEDVHTDLIVLANHACSTVDLVVVD